MIEGIMILGVCIGMASFARVEELSPWAWGAIGLALCVLSVLLLPLPMIRVVLAGAVAYGLLKFRSGSDRLP